MIGKTLNYISHHVIAILALVCSLLALAGASYAATQLSKNSVGTAQLKPGAVTPVKLSGKQFGGYVRMYAVVDANSELQHSSPQAKLSNWGNKSDARSVQPWEQSRGSRPSRRSSARRSQPPKSSVPSPTKRRRDRRSQSARQNRHTCRCQLGLAIRPSPSRSSVTEQHGLLDADLAAYIPDDGHVHRRGFQVPCSICAAMAHADYTLSSCGGNGNEGVFSVVLPPGGSVIDSGSACPSGAGGGLQLQSSPYVNGSQGQSRGVGGRRAGRPGDRLLRRLPNGGITAASINIAAACGAAGCTGPAAARRFRRSSTCGWLMVRICLSVLRVPARLWRHSVR